MKLRRKIASASRHVRQALRDARENARLATADERILAIRHPRQFEIAYERGLLDWLERNLPEVRARFELRLLPARVRDLSRYVLHVPWLQDPVQHWSRRAFRQANELAARFDAGGVPVINRVDRLVDAAKLTGSERIRTSGLRTPRMARIEDAEAFRNDALGLELPLIVREDWGHGGRIRLLKRRAQLERLDVSKYDRPIAVEFVDVRSPEDGLVRKYRYVVAGDIGLPLSMHICESWRTRGKKHVLRHDLIEEECSFASRAQEHASLFLAAREALGLDFVAFDYGIDRSGTPVVWEANPYPSINLTTGRGVYRAPPGVRAYAALTRLYLRAAGLEVPAKVEDILAHPSVFAK